MQILQILIYANFVYANFANFYICKFCICKFFKRAKYENRLELAEYMREKAFAK